MTLRFKPEKLAHALAFFSESGIPDLTKMKAAKLLYFADKEHLLRYGRPILGDVYFCLDYGPVPSVALNEMSSATDKPEVEDSDRKLLLQVLDVKRALFGAGYPVFKSKGKFDADVFSESELEVLRHVAKKYGPCTARQLVGKTHEDPTWATANQTRAPGGRTAIPYELFFVGASNEARQMLELFRAECEEAKEWDAILSQQTCQPLVNA